MSLVSNMVDPKNRTKINLKHLKRMDAETIRYLKFLKTPKCNFLAEIFLES